MPPYRNLFEPALAAPPAPAPSRAVPITFAILGALSAVQVATAWRAHGALAAQSLIGLVFLVAGVTGVARTWRSSWTTSSSSS